MTPFIDRVAQQTCTLFQDIDSVRIGDRASRTHISLGNTITTFGDNDALDIGKVLAGLRDDPAAFDAAVTALTPHQLGSVAKAGIGEKVTSYRGMVGAFTTFEVTSLLGVLDAAANSRDPAVKARVFEAGTRVIEHIRDSDTLLAPSPRAVDSAKQVAEGLTRLLGSDTRGIVDELNNRDETGKVLVAYLREMITEDPSAKNPAIGQQIAALRGAGTGQTAGRFIGTSEKSPNGDAFYRNAQNLGYYLGAVEATILSNIISSAVTVGPYALSLFTPVSAQVAIVAGVFNGWLRDHMIEVVADLQAGRKTLREALTELAVPRDPGSTHRYRGPADPFLQGAANTVITARM
jgi:hypothetical protein